MLVGKEEADGILSAEVRRPLGCLVGGSVLDGACCKAAGAHVEDNKKIPITRDALQVLGVGVHVVTGDDVAETVRSTDVSTYPIPFPNDFCLSAKCTVWVGPIVQ